MHLIYARFMSKALRDLGYLSFDEPFKKLIHQGMILGPDGNKMSKSKGNTVSPEEYISKYGADIFRMYIMFGFDYRQGGPWDEKGIDSMVKYFTRIEKLTDAINDLRKNDVSSKESIDKKEKELLLVKSNTIKMMTNNLNDFRFNTAIARSMELYNALSNYIREEKINKKVAIDTYEVFIKLLAPLAPHFAEEQWEKYGKIDFVYNENWPEVVESELVAETIDIPVQLNGKVKVVVKVSVDLEKDEMLSKIKENSDVKNIYDSNEIIKEIFIPGKILNIVAKK